MQWRSKSSAVQQPNHKCEITGKGNPKKIRDLQKCCSTAEFIKFKNHDNDKHPKQNQPYKCEQKCLHVKEYYTPEKVYDKLKCIYEYR